MLEAVKLPARVSDLDTGLADVDGDDLCERKANGSVNMFRSVLVTHGGSQKGGVASGASVERDGLGRQCELSMYPPRMI